MAVSGALEQHGSEEARRCKAAVGPAQASRREKLCKHHCRPLQHLGVSRTRKGQDELHRRNVGRDAPDPSARLGSNVGPDAGIRRLLRLHSNKERRSEVASCKAWKIST